MEFLLFECLQDLTGGDLVFMMGINLAIVDSSNTDTRTRHNFFIVVIYLIIVFLILTIIIIIIIFIAISVIVVTIIVLITRKIIMIDAFRYAGRALGIQLGAVIKRWTLRHSDSSKTASLIHRTYGWRPVFMLNMVLLIVTFLYIFFMVKEKKKPAKASSTGLPR